ncbi:hypothetical protein M8C21_004789, partial [Ambrosia artemisiifolia]
FMWPCNVYCVRYWHRNDSGSYVVLFCSMEHEIYGSEPGYMSAHTSGRSHLFLMLSHVTLDFASSIQHLYMVSGQFDCVSLFLL